MKKFTAAAILILLAAFIYASWHSGMTVSFDGDEIDGPLGALIGTLAAGGGLVLAGLIMLGVGLFLAFLFAGLGVLLFGGLAIGAVCLAAALSPLLLPALIPIAIIYFMVRKNRKPAAPKADSDAVAV